MVLESIMNPLRAERKPWEMIIVGFSYTIIALLLSYWIFQQYASLVAVFLTVIACIPLIINTLKFEEEKDLNIEKESTLLKEHSKALLFFVMLFFGMTLAFTFAFLVAPKSSIGSLFGIQIETINTINTHVNANAIEQFSTFSKVFFNNLKVLTFCLLFAFLYGAGAIFILTWNASVIGVAIGSKINNLLSNQFSYFSAIPIGLGRYLIHGIPEILAYFIGALAGGIISVAVIRHDFRTKKFEHIILDSADLIIISIVILLLAGLMEVYLTPVLFCHPYCSN